MLPKKTLLPSILVPLKCVLSCIPHRGIKSFICDIVLFHLGRNLEVFLKVYVDESVCILKFFDVS